MATIRPAITGIHSATEQVRGALDSLVAWIFDEGKRQVERSADMLDELGWPPPGHLPARLFDQITNGFSSGELNRKDVEEIIVSFYTPERVLEIFNGWAKNPLLQRRLPILREALEAHSEGRYALSIPAIIPQIEGLVASAFGHSGKLDVRTVKGYVEVAFPRDQGFDRMGVAFFLKILFDRFQWGSPIPLFSRHAILHGADVDYATEENSLRAILFLDQLQGKVGYLRTKRGSTYHLPSCRIIQGRQFRRVYGSGYSAIGDGLRPCRVCLPEIAATADQ